MINFLGLLFFGFSDDLQSRYAKHVPRRTARVLGAPRALLAIVFAFRCLGRLPCCCYLDVRVFGLELMLEHRAVLVIVVVLKPRVHTVRVRAVARDLDL